MIRPRSLLLASALTIASCGPVISQTIARVPQFEVDGQVRSGPLVDSRYGFLPDYNLALAAELERCAGVDTSLVATVRVSPERLSAVTLEALKALQDCRGAAGSQESLDKLFASLPVDRAAPTVLERARILAIRASPLTPDYDRTFWDLTGDGQRRSADPGALFTWGPYRATAGHGCTFQRTLRRMADDAEVGPMLREAFTGEEPLLSGLLAPGCDPDRARALLSPVATDPTRRDKLQFVIAQLADSPRVRQIYDDVFYGSGGVRLGYINDYVVAWRKAGRSISEVDAAFFFERSLQFDRLRSTAVTRFVTLTHRLDGPAEVRKLASDLFNFEGAAPRAYQVGRDATYFIDGGFALLNPALVSAWTEQSRVRASDVGLTDRSFDICQAFPLASCEGSKQ